MEDKFVGLENNQEPGNVNNGRSRSGSLASNAGSVTSAASRASKSGKIGSIRNRYTSQFALGALQAFNVNAGKRVTNMRAARNVMSKPNSQTRANRAALITHLKDNLHYHVNKLPNAGLYLYALQSEYDQAILQNHNQIRADEVLRIFKQFYSYMKPLFPGTNFDVYFRDGAPELYAKMLEQKAARNAVSRPGSPTGGARRTRRNRKGSRKNRKGSRKSRKGSRKSRKGSRKTRRN